VLRIIAFEKATVKDGSNMETTEREWLKVPEAATLLGLPKTRAYELIQQGELPAVRIGERSIRVNRCELEKFLLENRRVVAQSRQQGASMRS
jgi:excisionase family DNA binding protein